MPRWQLLQAGLKDTARGLVQRQPTLWVHTARRACGVTRTVSSSYPISAPDLTPPSTTGGEWTETPAYDDGTGLTTFTDTQASFGAFMHGWVLMPNVEQPSYLTIFGVPPGGQTLVVQGDASYSSIATVGATYRVIAPAGIQRNTGALANIGSEGEVTWNPHDRGPSNLWAGYRHVPAMAGWYDEGETTTTGAQSGWNLTGTYHCLNRQYDPWVGQWTTPDPAATPWYCLLTYCASDPLGVADSTGLAWATQSSDATTFGTSRDGQSQWKYTYRVETKNCSIGQHDKIVADLAIVLSSLKKAVEDMDWYSEHFRDSDVSGADKSTRDSLNSTAAKYFNEAQNDNSFSTEDLARVRKVLQKTLAAFDGETLEIECSCCNDNIAEFVHGVFWSHIKLCQGHWLQSDKDRRSTYFHELTHEYAGTGDKGYIVSTSAKRFAYVDGNGKAVAALSSKDEQETASNYEYFLRDNYIP